MGPRARPLELPYELTQLDQRFLTGPPAWLLALYRRIPMWAAQTLEAFRVRHRYDVVFSRQPGPAALSFALLLKLTRSRVPMVALFSWISRPKQAWFLRLVQSHITKLILPPPTQLEFAIDRLRLPAAKVVGIPWEMRELYARARFVVLPLHQSDTDNGVTCLLEAWSMSRPVICSLIDGQRGALDHGRNSLFVTPGDAEALRKAIVDLWDHPEESARMGADARPAVEEHRRLDRFIGQVSEVIREAAEGSR
jgi:hypothetical protein